MFVRIHQAIPISVALLSIGGAASAQLDPGDISLSIEEGRIVTGLISEAEGRHDGEAEDARLFIAELGEAEFEEAEPGEPGSGGSDVFQSPTPFSVDSFVTNTPGFDSGPGVFDPSASVGFEIISFGVYDSDSNTYVPTNGLRTGSTVEGLGISFNLDAVLTNDGGPGLEPSLVGPEFPSLGVFPNGRYHRHFLFALLPVDDPQSSNPMPLADPGVYMLVLKATTDQSGVEDSESFGILYPFAASLQEEEAAIEAAQHALGIESHDDEIDGDANGDGVVTIADVLYVIARFGMP